MWSVYIVQCRDGSLYTGISTDVTRRVHEHNSGKGGNYTYVRRPVVLRYQESQPNRSCALKREAAIKRLSRAQKELLLLSSDNPV